MHIPKRDLQIEYLCRSGPGGQHRNRKATGVRLTHKPSDITVTAFERRSRRQNLEMALKRLEKKLILRKKKKKKRKKTKPTKASVAKRVESKKRRSKTKSLRKRIDY